MLRRPNSGSMSRGRHAEGNVARAIENQTAKVPSDTFLWAAVGSIGLSLGLQAAGRKHLSLFVGQWAPTLLMLGLYNKLVKVAGSDRYGGGEEDHRERFDHEASAETVVGAGARHDSMSDELPAEEGAAYREHVEHEFGVATSPDRCNDAPFAPATEAKRTDSLSEFRDSP